MQPHTFRAAVLTLSFGEKLASCHSVKWSNSKKDRSLDAITLGLIH